MAEGKLEIDDPLEIKKTEDDSENIVLNENSEETENSNEYVNQENKTENNTKEEKDKRNQKWHKFKRYKIQEVIKPNQVILVQVIKDERGQKGAALSTFYFDCR